MEGRAHDATLYELTVRRAVHHFVWMEAYCLPSPPVLFHQTPSTPSTSGRKPSYGEATDINSWVGRPE